MISTSLSWYAVYTKSNYEKKIFNELLRKSIETYLPLHKSLRQWSDRKKWVEEPLIRSYLFVRATSLDYYKILSIPGVVRFVSFSGKPAPIPDYQIETLKKLMVEVPEFEISTEKFKAGDPVEIIAGNLMGISGELIEYKGKKKVVVKIDHIQHSLLINIPSGLLQRRTLALANLSI